MRHSFQSSEPSSLTIEHALQMRRALTLSEQRLWSAIAGRRLGVTFCRQVPLGRFIADFAARAATLVVRPVPRAAPRSRRAPGPRARPHGLSRAQVGFGARARGSPRAIELVLLTRPSSGARRLGGQLIRFKCGSRAPGAPSAFQNSLVMTSVLRAANRAPPDAPSPRQNAPSSPRRPLPSRSIRLRDTSNFSSTFGGMIVSVIRLLAVSRAARAGEQRERTLDAVEHHGIIGAPSVVTSHDVIRVSGTTALRRTAGGHPKGS
jgi:hypothetical protein